MNKLKLMVIKKVAGKLGRRVRYFQRALVYNIMNYTYAEM